MAKSTPKKKTTPKKSIKTTSPKSSKSKKVVAKKPTTKMTETKKSGKKKEDLMCFLTTACVNYHGLSDNCKELQTLRHFRDEYLMKKEEGRVLVLEYYNIAPSIVKMITEGTEQQKDYEFIYQSLTKACEHINNKLPERAQQSYYDMVNTLRKKYQV